MLLLLSRVKGRSTGREATAAARSTAVSRSSTGTGRHLCCADVVACATSHFHMSLAASAARCMHCSTSCCCLNCRETHLEASIIPELPMVMDDVLTMMAVIHGAALPLVQGHRASVCVCAGARGGWWLNSCQAEQPLPLLATRTSQQMHDMVWRLQLLLRYTPWPSGRSAVKAVAVQRLHRSCWPGDTLIVTINDVMLLRVALRGQRCCLLARPFLSGDRLGAGAGSDTLTDS